MIPRPLRIPLILLALSILSAAGIVTHQYVRRETLRRQVTQAQAQVDRLEESLRKSGRAIVLPPDDD
jgi:cell division protein FtsL